MKKQYRIVLQEPPKHHMGRIPGGGAIQHYIERLGKEAPGQWALFEKNRKHLAYLYGLKKKTPGLEMRVVSNGNKTFQIYFRYTPTVAEEVKAPKKTSAKK